MLDEKAHLRKHGPRLPINRDQGGRPVALPISEDGYKLAGTQFVLNVPNGKSDDSTSRNGSFANRIAAVDQQPWRDLYSLSHMRFDEYPFVEDIALNGYIGNARVLEKIRRSTGEPTRLR